MRSIDGPECKHGHPLFSPTACPECVAGLKAHKERTLSHPAFKRILERADFGGIEKRVLEGNPGSPPIGWPELTGSGNPETGDYTAGLATPTEAERTKWTNPWPEGIAKHPEMDRLHDLTHAYVQATVRGLRLAHLKTVVIRALKMLSIIPNPNARKQAADDALGKWMSAALDDPNVCAEMKADINEWFAAIEQRDLVQEITQLVRTANIVMRAEREKWKRDTFLEHYGTGKVSFTSWPDADPAYVAPVLKPRKTHDRPRANAKRPRRSK